jgi:hypothetical protein
MSDPIDGAIAATEGAGPTEVRLVQITVNLSSTGRPCHLAVPLDLTPLELLELTAWLAAPEGMRALLPTKPSPLVVARGIPTIPRAQ